MPEKPLIYYLTLTSRTNHVRHYCKTLAFDLDEALRRARHRYGPIELYSCGTCILPDDHELVYGSGDFIRSHHDHHLHPEALAALCA